MLHAPVRVQLDGIPFSWLQARPRIGRRSSVRRRALSVAWVAACFACARASGNLAQPAPSGWTIVWSDEFDGSKGSPPRARDWTIDTGDGCAAGNCGWGNQEKEYYSNAAENISLTGQGQLAIVARRSPPGLSCYYGPCRYTSAKIRTQGRVEARYGRVEARMKLAAGQGLWPAFWMLGSSLPSTPWPDCGELDIMENHGSRMESTSSAIHGPGYFGDTPFVHAHALLHSTFADSFHVFAVEWDSAGIRFFVDGTMHYAVEKPDVVRRGRWVFDQPFFLILNLAVGGTFDGDPTSEAIFPATMLVDYVRIYARQGAARAQP